MSMTLARRIRRIGILPTTYKSVSVSTLKEINGVATTVTEEKKIPERHREELPLEELKARREALITAARWKRKEFYRRRSIARAASPVSPVLASSKAVPAAQRGGKK